MNYTIWHLHSMLSNNNFIDSSTKFEAYIYKAKELGMKAIGFSEHGNIFKWIDKKILCEKEGLKYIHGVEAYISETLEHKELYHIGLIARNWNGVRELNKLISNAWNRKDGHYYKNPRITFQELENTSNNIIVTTACLAGVLNKCIDMDFRTKYLKFLIKNKDRCFLEIQHHNVEDQKKYNQRLYELHKTHGIRLIAGTDTHSLDETSEKAKKVLQKSKGIHIKEEEGFDMTFKSYAELIKCYENQNTLPMNIVIEAIENTNVLADMVEEFDLDKSYKYPKLYDNPEKVLQEKVKEGIVWRGVHKYPNFNEYKDRILYEIDTYKSNDAIDYVLLEEKIKSDMRKRNIYPGFSRGSVSGSEVAYLLGITEVDSIKHNLNFERFINKERVSLPDIDTDWSPKDRDKVFEYIFNMEGVYCSLIVAFNTIGLKGAIRDVGRALEIPLKEVDIISKNIDTNEQQYREQYPELFKYVDLLNGVITSVSNHPAGIVVSPIPIDENVGLFTTSTQPYPVSMLNMKEIDKMGYVKLDVLGLDNIYVINETCKLANINRLNPDNVDVNDMNVWRSMRESNLAIFQFESDYSGDYLKQILDDKVTDKIKKLNPNFNYIDLLSMANGAIRPAGASYREQLANGEFRDNGLKEINDYLSNTLGHCIFQEQIMGWLVNFCGYSGGESDQVRRAIGKKLGTEQLIPEIEERFIEYSHKTYGLSKEKLKEIAPNFLQVIIDASDYGFSLNHSDPYSYIGYICAYLRYYYPLEFLTVLLRKEKDDLKETSKIISYAESIGITINPVKYGYSIGDYHFDKDTKSIYKGVSSIKGLNEQMADELYELSKKNFDNFIDLLVEIRENTSVKTNQMKILISLNYFDKFGKNKRLMEIYTKFEERYKKTHKDATKVKRLEEIREFTDTLTNESFTVKEQLQMEYEYLGYCETKYNVSNNIFFVIDVNTKYTPKLSLYNLKTGKVFECKCKKNTMKKLGVIEPFKLVVVNKLTKKPKMRKVGEEWVTMEEMEFILEDYQIR